MKFITTLLSLLLASFPALATTQSEKLMTRIEQQLDKISLPVDDKTEDLLEELEEKYGFSVHCDRRFFNPDRISKGECYLGLQSLDKALAEVNPDVDRERLDSIHIIVSDLGEWHATSGAHPTILIPYRARPEKMAQFLNAQKGILLATTPEELQKATSDLEKSIRDRYLVKVERDEDAALEHYGEGLAKLQFVLDGLYGKDGPSREAADRLGFDTIVVGNDNDRLYEDRGELRVGLNYADSPGDQFGFLIHQIRLPYPGWINWATSVPYVLPRRWTWEDVQEFKQARTRVEELVTWIAAKLPDSDVNCQLNSSQPDEVTIKQCEKGLLSLQQGLVKSPDADTQIRAKRVLIVDSPLQRHKMPDDSTHLIHYGVSAEQMFKDIAK